MFCITGTLSLYRVSSFQKTKLTFGNFATKVYDSKLGTYILKSFLSERTFHCSNSASRHVTTNLPSHIGGNRSFILYADDILLVVRGAKNEGLHQKLQVAVEAVGFGISAMMSNCFYCSPNVRQEQTQTRSNSRSEDKPSGDLGHYPGSDAHI